jgi:hypothetical protein
MNFSLDPNELRASKKSTNNRGESNGPRGQKQVATYQDPSGHIIGKSIGKQLTYTNDALVR